MDHFSHAQHLYLHNNLLANTNLLGEIEQQCWLTGLDVMTQQTRPPLTTAYLSRHLDLFMKLAYNISVYIDQHNNNQIQAANPVQTQVPRSWMFQQIRLLNEYQSMGRRRRSSLVTTIINKIAETDGLDRQRLDYLSDDSFTQLQQLVVDTRRRLECSRQYLQNPAQNRQLYDDCFRPELDHVIKKQRSFNLVPKPDYKKKLTNDTRKTVLRSLRLPDYVHGAQTLRRLLSLDKVRPGNMVFSEYILTDGFATSIPFYKPAKHDDSLPDLEPSDFQPWELAYLP
ncbi:unnamed protein product [Absidia cylindrospora]